MRKEGYSPLLNTHISPDGAQRLAEATQQAWEALLQKDLHAWGKATTQSLHAQLEMFPNMMTDEAAQAIKEYSQQALGYKITGAGGGGYLVLIAEKNIPNATRIKAQRD